MGGAVFSPSCLTWDQTMVEVVKIMATSFKRFWACTAALGTPKPAAGHCWPMPPLETCGHSQASLGQSLVITTPFLGFWCTQGFVCALQESVSAVLCKFCNQSHWPPKSNSLGVLSPFVRSQVWKSVVGPRTFLTVREFLWYNCSAVFGSSAQQLYGEVNGDLQESLCHRLCGQVAAPRVPAPVVGHCWLVPLQETQIQVWLSFYGVSVFLCTQGFVWALPASLAGMGFDSKCNFDPPTILLGLLLCSWMCSVFFWWDSTFSCRWLFSSKL